MTHFSSWLLSAQENPERVMPKCLKCTACDKHQDITIKVKVMIVYLVAKQKLDELTVWSTLFKVVIL